MYQEPKHITSSYTLNNIGKTIYETVIKYKPKKIIDFGVLYGYSTVCLAQGVRDNGFGEIVAYDLFEDYKYKKGNKDVVLNNLKLYNLEKYVTIIKKDFNDWLNEKEKFDLLHLDISNTGDIIQSIYNHYPNSLIMFEGGSEERDNIDWMVRFNKPKINKSKVNFTILNPKFPSISIINNKNYSYEK